MTAPQDFVAFILTHGRPDRVKTLHTLRLCGYTGRIVLVVDDEDKTLDAYRANFGADVHVFSKAAVAAVIDEADNFTDRRAIVYARNACFAIARELGFRYFVQLDDDYTNFRHRRDEHGRQLHTPRKVRNLDSVFSALLDLYKSIPALAIAMAQTGDLPMGATRNPQRVYHFRRKAMNSFFCSTERPFQFSGRINEDVNTYASLGSRGGLFFTVPAVELQQMQTQINLGGMTDLYRAGGTYVKSFYSVLFHPSSVRVARGAMKRLHHQVRWRFTVPVILRASVQRFDPA